MQKHEFEERIESTVSDEDYKLIEFVYQFHPVIRNVSGKDEVAELYKSFGILVKSADDWKMRKALQERAARNCNNLLALIQLAKTIFHLKSKRVKYWSEKTIDVRGYLRSWRDADSKRYGK